MNADKIIVLENGSILESGNFEDLMKINGSFKSIYNMQNKRSKMPFIYFQQTIR